MRMIGDEERCAAAHRRGAANVRALLPQIARKTVGYRLLVRSKPRQPLRPRPPRRVWWARPARPDGSPAPFTRTELPHGRPARPFADEIPPAAAGKLAGERNGAPGREGIKGVNFALERTASRWPRHLFSPGRSGRASLTGSRSESLTRRGCAKCAPCWTSSSSTPSARRPAAPTSARSEERRVGKECRFGGRAVR